ncbi:TetR/AcrR family transcriptional repressor of nem operon [Streptomyces sp. V4I23]|uniref:TetR/AcrR family transcriptional regulator n=1 Tax=Streptomyces sp. V4I23 TaxID=3042282 RepID=UPI002788C7EC|nr:TetR/AcrR family transcriptional regulator [Streptomyces sp. V4I23]MDQ1006383.1 TetR/AcrR family transcriptional repressor of nem operon [Streptomyces sp. V4I23]
MPDIKHFDPEAALEAAMRLFWRQGVAATGVQDVVNATGLNRSSLYATFGGKQDLYLAALRRYMQQWSESAFRRVAEDGRGLPAVCDFFADLIEVRCSGEYARWGCMMVNAHAGAGPEDPEVRALLDRQHQLLRDALEAALTRAEARGELSPHTDTAAAADALALLAYGVNVRSRAGADPAALKRTVSAALGAMARQPDH